MEKVLRKLAPVLASLALVITTVSVNTACSWVGFQPQLPKNVQKLRKF